MSKIYFFRHAQASLGSDNYDILSKKGELQALYLGKYLVKSINIILIKYMLDLLEDNNIHMKLFLSFIKKIT